MDRLDFLSRNIYSGLKPSNASGISSSTAVGVTTGGVTALSGNPNIVAGSTVSYWTGTTGSYGTGTTGSYWTGTTGSYWTGTTGPSFVTTSTSANTATTVTISTIFDPVSNTGTQTIPGDLISDPLAGYDRYSTPNWDGYGAKAITPETIAVARQFIRDLPKIFGEPDIAPGADGTIGLEWSFRNRPLRKLFIDIGPGNRWSAYWRRASGETRTLPSVAIAADAKASLQTLFQRLNS
jgi:hypothetical protein